MNSCSPSPPKTRLVFRVGVIGHRPPRLDPDVYPALRSVLGIILDAVSQAVRTVQGQHGVHFRPVPAVLRLISPLAEGADRLVAAEGLARGFQLQCALPFLQEKNKQDSQDPEFLDLLAQAEARFELDGDRSRTGDAYAAAGRVVLNQSDILLAVWDGTWQHKRGGTEETLREALAFRLPVIWIDAKSPDRWKVLRRRDDLPDAEDEAAAVPSTPAGQDEKLRALVAELVEELLAPPGGFDTSSAGQSSRPSRFWALRNLPHRIRQRLVLFGRMFHTHGHTQSADLRRDFFAERQPCWNLFIAWKLFRDLVGKDKKDKIRFQPLRVVPFEQAVAKEWREDAPKPLGWANLVLRAHYAWADKLADYYADHYRSAFVLIFLLGVLAVLLALVPLAVAPGHGSQPTTSVILAAIAEPLVVLAILILAGVNWAWRWHERWMDYRLVAELVRQLRILLPLGGGHPFPRLAGHLSGFGDPARTWMYWHAHNIEREVGLPDVSLDQQVLCHTLEDVKRLQQGQQDFHHTNYHRAARIAGRLHIWGYSAFLLTLVLVIVHFLPFGAWLGLPAIPHLPWPPEQFLSIATAILPALGAALAGINNQGEFARIANRSRGMEERLQGLGERIAKLQTRLPSECESADSSQTDINVAESSPSEPVRSQEITAIAAELAQLMVDEVSDWRVVFTDRGGIGVS